jgi:hypothetical protein
VRNRFVRAYGAGLFAAFALWIPIGASAESSSCATVAACIFGINTASGVGVEGKSSSGRGVDGVSALGYGVAGASAKNDGVVGHTAVNPTSAGTGKAGVAGYDDSKNNEPYNSGVYGVSMYSMGVQGRSTYGSGLFALSLNGNAVMASAGSPLYSGFTNAGVVAQSASGDGVIAVGNTTGIVGFATTGCMQAGCLTPLQNEIPSGAAVTAGTDLFGLGLSIVTDTNPYDVPTTPNGVGATIDSGSIGMMITSGRAGRGDPGLIVNGNMAPRDDDYPIQGAIISGFNALSVTAQQVGIAVTGSPAIISQGAAGGGLVFEGTGSTGVATSQLDDAGNLVIAGKLTEHGTLTTAVHNSDGTYSTSYTAHSTLPTVEDVGEANIVSGAAFVPIDSSLRKAINVLRGYLVFVTPQGATTGLYVTNKSPMGFSVREIGNARDSLAFDYRIVAQPNAEQGPRLAKQTSTLPTVPSPKALFYRHLKPLRFIHGKLDPASVSVPSM